MIVFKEYKIANQSYFLKQIFDNNGNIINTRKVINPLHQIEKEGFLYFLLYDDKMRIINHVYTFLNHHLKESPITTRAKAAYALRLLYCFLSLSNVEETLIDEKIVKQLIQFLRGLDSNPKEYGLKTQRSAATVNGYLSIYRTFFKCLNIECEPLFRGTTVKMSSFGYDESQTIKTKYDNNLKKSNDNEYTTPKYISPDEFGTLYRLCVSKSDQTSKIIIHLMYGYGLRLGEVLGLTLEDIKETRDNGKLVPVLILRNRMSDQKYQFSKGLPHVSSKKQYSTKDYVEGNQKIILTYSLYEELINYIEETHSYHMENNLMNYETGHADIVSVTNKPDNNHYVFLNKHGRLLSDQTWNNNLKKYFKDVSITIDIEMRENNLSHRFRHGFAMFHAKYSSRPADILSLQKMMRHRSLSTTMVYYNPTPEDELKTKMEFQEELYTLIPELKEKCDE